ncbi:MAG: zinc ABC transporter substrate-binding protein [Treponema sp.]|nr:zinc ABC transporter substrate-binding protein [Treponema sp.]
MFRTCIAALAGALVLLAGCAPKTETSGRRAAAPVEAAAGRDSVAANAASDKGPAMGRPLLALSILPQTWFADRISGGTARTLVLVGPGQNPHSYEPGPKQMSSLAEAGAWILSGAEFEISLRPKIESLFPKLLIVDGTEGVAFRNIEEHEDEDEEDEDSAGHGADSAAPEIDRHTWLGSAPAKILSAHIRDALCALDPAGAEEYKKNHEALVREIDGEFAALKTELAPLRGRSVFVYHPSFGYFLDEFGIRQEAVETGGKEPGPRTLSRLIDKARQERAAAIFVQAQFPVNSAKTAAAAAGAELVSLDPLSPGWLANIRLMGEALKKALR